MKNQRFIILLIITNLSLLFMFFVRNVQENSTDTVPIIRARVIEMVDSNGITRAQFKVESTGETVFRLRDAKWTIRMKMSAAEDGSGFLLLDDETNPAFHVLALKNGTSMVLSDKSGWKKEIKK